MGTVTTNLAALQAVEDKRKAGLSFAAYQ